jgi:lipopolysaccharide assembly outer membrane protein LptD (OstA)
MGITRFFYLLLIFSILMIFSDIDYVQPIQNKDEKPTVSFYDSVIYNINDEHVKTVVQSKEAYMYKEREEMISGTIVTRDENEKYKKNTNSVSADNIIKMDNDVYLEGNVNLQLANGTNLRTEQLQYNLVSKIAQNEIDFIISKGFHDFHGSHLYLDEEKRYVKAKNTHFKIKVEDE